jgi:hypothetical protein
MKKWISLILIELLIPLGHVSYGAPLPIPGQENVFPNYLVNPGFENGKYGWTASGGATATANTTAKGEGSYGYDWDSNSAGQTLISNAITVPAGLAGKNGFAFCRIETPSGTPTHLLSVDDGSTNIVTAQTISSSSTSFVTNGINFPFGASGSTVRLKLTSVSSNEPEIYIDSCYLGTASNLSLASSATIVASGFYATTGSCTVSRTSTSLGAFGTTAACPGPTVETNIGPGSLLTTDADKPTVFTINNLPPGTYVAHFAGEAVLGTSDQLGALAINDGTTTAGQRAVRASSSGFQIDASGTFTYTTTANRTFELYASSAANTMTVQNAASNMQMYFWLERYPSATEVAIRPELYNWRVDANISGANPSLGTSAQSAYTAIEDAGLTLTNNTGNGVLTAQIPCSSTNAPTGTTCSVGNESVGVAFTLPVAGDVLACAEFSHNIVTAATGVVNSTFEIVETPTNAQTISQEGRGRVQSGFNTASSTITFPHKVCGTFTFSSVGQKALRLFYEQAVSATVTTSQLFADAGASNGQRDIHWTVIPINQGLAPAYYIGSVISGSTGMEKLERARVTVSSAAAAVTAQTGSWISVANGAGAGLTTATLTGFVGEPVCTCMVIGAASTSASWCGVTATPSSTTLLITRTRAGAAENGDIDLICMGPR